MVNEAWDMKYGLIKSQSRNKTIVALLAGWFVVATLVFAWAAWQAEGYKAAYKAYVAQVDARVAAAQTDFAKLKETGDETAVHTALGTFSNELTAISPPTIPTIFGLALGADPERARQASIAGVITKLHENIQMTAQFMAYQKEVAVQLQLLSLASAGNEAQIRALATAWQEATAKVNGLTPPMQLAGVHAALIQNMQAVQATIAHMADLFKADDEAGFKTAQQALEPQIAAFQPHAHTIRTIAGQLDAERAAIITAITQNR